MFTQVFLYYLQAKTPLRSVLAWMPHSYHVARSVSGFVRVVDWNMWKSIAQLHCALGCCAAKPAPFAARLADCPTVQSPNLFTASLFTFENLNKMLIFFTTKAPIKIRPGPRPAHILTTTTPWLAECEMQVHLVQSCTGWHRITSPVEMIIIQYSVNMVLTWRQCLNSWKMPSTQNRAWSRQTWFTNNHTIKTSSICHIKRKDKTTCDEFC